MRHLRHSIGVVVPELTVPLHAEAASAITARARELDYLAVVTSCEGKEAHGRAAVEALQSQGVRGLVVVPMDEVDADLSHLFELSRAHFPLVLLGDVRGLRADVVAFDHAHATATALEHLIAAGHTRILYFAGPDSSQCARSALAGVWQVFSGSPLAFGDGAVVRVGASEEAGYRAGLDVFGRGVAREQPTAVVCFHDAAATGLLAALDALGLQVPEEVSVVGCSGLPSHARASAQLSTVELSARVLGTCAVDRMVERIEGEFSGWRRVLLRGELVQRGSTCLAPGRAVHGPRLAVSTTRTGAPGTRHSGAILPGRRSQDKLDITAA